MKHLYKLIPGFFACMLAVACESNDCTLYNIVNMYAGFYKDGIPKRLNDTLTITACGSDSILLNRAVGMATLTLPLSYYQSEDTLVLTVKGKEFLVRDTLWVSKTNRTHFESPDCPTTFFHNITGIRSTHIFIDTVTVTRSSVNYDQTENLQIHLSATD